jgi:hypothetical protein
MGLAHPVRHRRNARHHCPGDGEQPAGDEAFIAAKTTQRRESSIRALLKYPRQVLIVIGLTARGTTAFYTYTTYMQKFLRLSVGLSDNQTTMVSAGSLIFALCLRQSTECFRTGSGESRC